MGTRSMDTRRLILIRVSFGCRPNSWARYGVGRACFTLRIRVLGLLPKRRISSVKEGSRSKDLVTLGGHTNVPFPCSRYKTPSYTRSITACFTVPRLTRNISDSCASLGMLSCGFFSAARFCR